MAGGQSGAADGDRIDGAGLPRQARSRCPHGALESYDVEDVIFGHVRLEGGFWFAIEGVWLHDRTDRAAGMFNGFDAYGTAGQAHLQPLELYAERDGVVVRVDDGESTGLDLDSSLVRELEDVVAALRTGTASDRLATPREALTVQAVTDALYRSAREGREVPVEVPTV